MKYRTRIPVCERQSTRFIRDWRGKTPDRGVTLLEMLFCAFIITLIAVATLSVMGDGRVMRERARQRAELALIAQGELDQLRCLPMAQLTDGQQTVQHEDWPQSVRVVETIRKRDDGFLELEFRAERKSPSGVLKVVLYSIHPGGRR